MTDTMKPDPAPTGLQIARDWPVVFMIGLITFGLGIVVIAWPKQTLVVISIVIGLQILLYGIFRLVSAFADETVLPGVTAFVGIVGIVVGIVVLRRPFTTVAVLAVLLGVVWIIAGSIELLGAIADRSLERRGMAALGGLLSIGVGVVVVSWPAPTVTVVAWISGLYLIVFGLFICAMAFRLRSVSK
jgi:uncharacterized membrane protein HdeD (DUF308 family)